jgi:hypothetical protein
MQLINYRLASLAPVLMRRARSTSQRNLTSPRSPWAAVENCRAVRTRNINGMTPVGPFERSDDASRAHRAE